MKYFKPFPLSVLVAVLLGSCAGPVSQEPKNLSTLKSEVKEYVTTKRYDADLAIVAASANEWVAARARSGTARPAVVFDIDETTLSNLDHMRQLDWGYQPESWSKWVMTGKAPAISPVREVYKTARANNVTVFFITGRRASEKEATARNLRTQGMGDFEALLVRSDDSKTAVGPFKAEERRNITEKGYTIIANIGDQQSDLDGGYSERTFKLPNPFYLIP